MERLLKQCDKEFMKMAMLKHEETFKEQVYELHRLYRVQKMLMNDMKRNRPNRSITERRNLENEISPSHVNYTSKEPQKSQRDFDLERPAEEFIVDEGGDGVLEIEDESDIELTLGFTSYSRRKKDETTLNSDSGPSFSSSSTGSSHKQRISNKTHKRMEKQEELTAHEWGPDMHPSFQSGRKMTSDVEEKLRQERLQRPPWLFHLLNIKHDLNQKSQYPTV